MAFAVTVWAAFAISRLIRFILEEDVYPRLTLPRGVPNAFSTGIHYVLLLFGFVLAVAATGADLSKFTLLAGAFGVGIGFGLQNVVNNFISGLILITERPIMPGDTIEVGNMVGDVKRIGMRSSTIRTWEGAEVIVPNGNLISSEVINWTLSDRQRRVEIPVGVAYGSNTAKVTEILQNVASQHEDVLENPAPYVLFIGFGDSSLDFLLRFWTGRFEGYFRIRSQIVYGIEAALNEAGIVIPFPQRDLHVKSVTPEAGATLHGEGAPDMDSATAGAGRGTRTAREVGPDDKVEPSGEGDAGD
jgi:small-conductance mechanosensitive channel